MRPTGLISMITMVYLPYLYSRPLTTVSGLFMWVLGIQTWVLIPAQQSLYPQTHLPCVFLCDLNNLLNFFRESIHLCQKSNSLGRRPLPPQISPGNLVCAVGLVPVPLPARSFSSLC